MKFTRGSDIKKKIGIGHTVLDDLREHPVCKPMNDPEKDLDGRFKEGDKVWINPDNQFSFNAMWCDEKVLREWMEGKGPMVKGKNANEKKKYWDYAVFEATPIKLGDYINTKLDHVQWMIKYHYRFFKEFTSDFDPHHHGGYGLNMSIKEPMDLKGIRSKEAEKKEKSDERVIKDMFAPYVREIVKDLEYRSWDNIRHELEKELYGIKRTLYTMGIGFFGASNTPEEIRNLSWVTGIVYAKGIYEYLKKIDYPMPDWEWLSKKSY
jgi:hypothetical protein